MKSIIRIGDHSVVVPHITSVTVTRSSQIGKWRVCVDAEGASVLAGKPLDADEAQRELKRIEQAIEAWHCRGDALWAETPEGNWIEMKAEGINLFLPPEHQGEPK